MAKASVSNAQRAKSHTASGVEKHAAKANSGGGTLRDSLFQLAMDAESIQTHVAASESLLGHITSNLPSSLDSGEEHYMVAIRAVLDVVSKQNNRMIDSLYALSRKEKITVEAAHD